MKNLNKKIQTKFEEMCKTGKLFRVSMTGQEVWDSYLIGFPKEEDPIFRDPNSSSHNCNNCKNFIRRYGNVVSIDSDYNVTTIFDVDAEKEFIDTCKSLTKLITDCKIVDVFFETFDELQKLPYESCSKSNSKFQLGMAKNVKRYTKEEAEKFGVVKPDEVRSFDHLHLFVPKEFVDTTGKSVEAIMGEYRDAKNVFKRGMEDISFDTLTLVKDLINQGSLLNGDSHLFKVQDFINFKYAYDNAPTNKRDNWCWANSYKMSLAKFRNELIGTLCVELSGGEDLNKACQSWNKRVDPANYMKATAPITKKQIDEAKKFVEENGYKESFDRRLATINDIKISEILHSNAGDGKIKTLSPFDNVKATNTRHKRSEFDGIEEVNIEKFMKDILPGCTSIEAFLQNYHSGNMVSLTTANNPDSKPIFKWSNNYSWTFNGNIAGKSEIKEEVKTKGGKVDGVLRFSMMWADGDGDNSDLDLHCIEPSGNTIFFGSKVSPVTGGNLDIDITQPNGKLSVENITYPSLSRMKDGVYKLVINQYSGRGSKGFKAEIEFNGELYSYCQNTPVRGAVHIADVTLKNSVFSIAHRLPAVDGIGVSKEIYGIETNEFHKVNLVCLSPNHWGENNIGNKHYLFMLDKCKSPNSIRGFHNENLIPELLTHRKVMEVLGATNNIESTDSQLSGLGFNSTVKDELIVKLQGTHKRMIKIKF